MSEILEQFGQTFASVATVAAVASFVWTLVSVITYPKAKLDLGQDSFEHERRTAIRKASVIYRWLEPLIHELARLFRHKGAKLDDLQRNLVVSKEKLPWKAEEFLATKFVEGTLIGLSMFGIGFWLGYHTLATLLAAPTMLFYSSLYSKTMADRAKKRMHKLRIRMPFAIDLIALMMEAGGGFQESLETVVEENQSHPVGDEFGEVLRQIALGRTRAEALRSLQTRMDDDDISELVFAINKGEELGTPLSAILRDQADQIRIKRSQWGEKAAAEAEVQLVFPGMVVMIACLLVILGPILLPALLPVL